MENKNKAILLGMIGMIVVLLSGTYAYYRWSSTDNINVNVNIEGSTVTFVGGDDVTGTLIPSASRDDAISNNRGIKKEVTVKASDTGSTMSLFLNLDKIPDGVKHKSFIYELYYNDTTLVTSGNFGVYNASTNAKGVTYATSGTTTLTLFEDRNVRSTDTDKYTLYLWFDGANFDNPSSMQNQTPSTLSFSLYATGKNAKLA